MGPQLSGAYTFGALHAPRLGFQVSNTPETTPLIISRGVPLFLPSLSPFSSKRCSNLRSLVLLLSAAVLTVAAPGRPHPAMNTSSFPAPGPQDTLTGYPLSAQEYSTGLFGPYSVGWNVFFTVFGIVLCQLKTYLRSIRFKTDPRWRKGVTFAVLGATFANAVIMAENSFYWTTFQERSTYNLERYRPWDAVGPITGGMVAVLVQGMFAQRSYCLMGQLMHNPIPRIIFVLVVTVGMLCGFAGSLALGGLSFISWYGNLGADSFTVQQAQAWWLWSSAITDIINTVTLTVLLKSQAEGYFAESDSVLYGLIWLNVQTGAYTTIFALLGAILSICFKVVTDINADYCAAFYIPLPALYAVSLFTTLVARDHVANRRTESSLVFNVDVVRSSDCTPKVA